MISSTASDFLDKIEIDAGTLHALRQAGADLRLLDVREDWERALCALPDTIDIPMASIASELERLPTDTPLVVICHHGGRSLQVAMWLRQQSITAVSLKGGIDIWARQIDTSLAIY